MKNRLHTSRYLQLPLLLILACHTSCQSSPPYRAALATPTPTPLITKPLSTQASSELKQLIEAATEQTKITTGYDPTYVGITYPGGDVPAETGVCSDVVVRSFRKVGIDLQKELHEDMGRAWAAYPKKWGASRPDANIDHRRVLNLTTWFERQKKSVPVTTNRDDYLPGDIVSWDLGNNLDHIGLVVNVYSEDSKGYLIVHNIGLGARTEDVLFNWKITGHYRYFEK
ncbi:MAG TPA: DUF1287 domain-containing protein [Pyrinomonadaceae bacterium]|nr:DUF1287 domain-containing protein [Pyrinomonadaceae bacterium]